MLCFTEQGSVLGLPRNKCSMLKRVQTQNWIYMEEVLSCKFCKTVLVTYSKIMVQETQRNLFYKHL